MKLGSTLFLRCALFLLCAIALAAYVFIAPEVAEESAAIIPALDFAHYLMIAGLYGTAVPFFFAVYQALKLLSFIDESKAFSGLSVKALSAILRCAIAMSACLCAALPVLYRFVDVEDAPGLMLIGLAFALAPLVIATFAAVLQKLLEQAIAMKDENDLTV